MIVLGIFGPIASGKSTARRFFEERGFFGIDADAIVHELYDPFQAGADAISDVFGKSFLNADGGVDRKKLLAFLVEHPDRLSDVHRVVHPLVAERIRGILRALPSSSARADVQRVVIESVYFDPSYLGQFVDFLLEVSASREVCLRRALARGISQDTFDFFWKLSPHYEADFSVVNDAGLEELEGELGKVLEGF